MTCIWGMMAHVIYTAIDPNRPATLSPEVVQVIRGLSGLTGFWVVRDDVLPWGRSKALGISRKTANPC